MMQLVNLTGHKLRLTDGRGIVVLPSQGRARVTSESKLLMQVEVEGLHNKLRVTRLFNPQIVNLPEPQPNTLYIVSGIVAASVPERMDVVAPGQLDRDSETGRVIGCRGFVKPSQRSNVA